MDAQELRQIQTLLHAGEVAQKGTHEAPSVCSREVMVIAL